MTITKQDGIVQSWGRIQRSLHSVIVPSYRDELPASLALCGDRTTLPIGLRRSYGDSNLNSGGCLVDMTHLDRLMAFDPRAGTLLAEGGLSIDDILRVIVPLGWFLTTTPGTRNVTVGGAVANDVHGKNQHLAGTFGNSVRSISLVRSDGQHDSITMDNGELFSATIGGLGLTGAISSVEFALSRIESAYLDVERIPFANVDEFHSLAQQSSRFEHTVAWIDCLSVDNIGRGIFQRANWCRDGQLDAHSQTARLSIAVDAPARLLNPFTMRMFNALYHFLQRRGRSAVRTHYAPFLYPLDGIANWNRLYGSAGLYQYQCLLPKGQEAALSDLLAVISRSGAGSFLAVLKTFGDVPSRGLLSFASAGTTLALDFRNLGEATLRLFSVLDEIVLQAGGRLYAAKDGRMPARMFRAGYPALQRFHAHVDPAFSSDFWRRVSA